MPHSMYTHIYDIYKIYDTYKTVHLLSIYQSVSFSLSLFKYKYISILYCKDIYI